MVLNPIKSTSERVILNLRGTKFDVQLSEFNKLPKSRLGRLKTHLDQTYISTNLLGSHNEDLYQICDDFDLELLEFYFNRDPRFFHMILAYYTGDNKIHLDENVCVKYFQEQLLYWDLDELHCFDDCCQHKFLGKLDDIDKELIKQKQIIDHYEFKEDFVGNHFFPRMRKKVWLLIENPTSSKRAIIYAIISYAIQILSIIDIIFLSFQSINENEDAKLPFVIIEYLCIAWFTFEFLVRFIACPSKLKFISSQLNLFDFISIITFYIYLQFQSYEIMIRFKNFARTLRIISIVKIFSHFDKLKTLGNTVANSLSEISVYFCYLGIGVLVFSSLLWAIEHQEANTKFTSIPASFWWAIVTITTVGYGDVTPQSVEGKVIAGACAIWGVLLIALPTGLLANNFSREYRLIDYRKRVIEVYESKKPKFEMYKMIKEEEATTLIT